MESETILIGARSHAVWPGAQALHAFEHPDIVITDFDDAAAFHPPLIARVLALAAEGRYSAPHVRAYGGTKVYHLQRWDCDAADLVNARALTLAQRLMKSDAAVIDLSWANVYGPGDYAMPHSHARTTVSIVYILDPGEPDPADSFSGQLMLVDPRVEACCKIRRGAVTTPLMPVMQAGRMVAFPSVLVHSVNPYTGRGRPRITLAWNIDKTVIPGAALPGRLA